MRIITSTSYNNITFYEFSLVGEFKFVGIMADGVVSISKQPNRNRQLLMKYDTVQNMNHDEPTMTNIFLKLSSFHGVGFLLTVYHKIFDRLVLFFTFFVFSNLILFQYFLVYCYFYCDIWSHLYVLVYSATLRNSSFKYEP